jgi:hypothetical protein
MKIIALLLSFIGVAMLVLSFTKVVAKTAVKKNINVLISIKTDDLVKRSPVDATAAGKWQIVNRQAYKPAMQPGIKHNYWCETDDRPDEDKTGRLSAAHSSNGYKAASVTYRVTSVPVPYNAGKGIKQYGIGTPKWLADTPITAENELAFATTTDAPVYVFN